MREVASVRRNQSSADLSFASSAVAIGRPIEVGPRVDVVSPIDSLELAVPISPQRGKRALDVFVCCALLVVSFPVVLVAAALVAGSGRGPVVFRQERIGRGGAPFEMFKLRTMAPGSDGSGDHVTAIGRFLRRFSIDELPQLVNVIRGDMSLVGPRPEITEIVAQYAETFPGYIERHRGYVGLTGLAQVRGLRGAGTSISLRVAADNEYIDSWSLRQDCLIMLRTLLVISHGS